LGQSCCAHNSCTGGCCAEDKTCVIPTASCGASSGTCGAGGACGTNMAPCGGNNQSCCDPTKQGMCSAAGTVCYDPPQAGDQAVCGTCGGANQPCCDNNVCHGGGCCVFGTCRASGSNCGSTMCMNGSCGGGTCGGFGQRCCATGGGSGVCTAPYANCLGGASANCEPCGGSGQRCCWDYRLGAFATCAPPFKADASGSGSCTCKP
jgi:hypothetical protein